jgi:hypothetical protein
MSILAAADRHQFLDRLHRTIVAAFSSMRGQLTTTLRPQNPPRRVSALAQTEEKTLRLLNTEQILDLAQNLHNTQQLAFELKGQLILALLDRVLVESLHWKRSEAIAALRETSELANLWINERERMLCGSRP